MPVTAPEIYHDDAALAEAAAARITDALAMRPGPVSLCLAGGTTPRRLYQCLAKAPWRDRLPLDRLHWFWGDERVVPKTDPDSNYGMARQALLDRLAIPPGHLHPIDTEGPAPAAAYARILQDYYGATQLDPARPLFDALLLGLGEDGHIASLFPNDSALDERELWVTSVTGARPQTRISLTYPALNSARHVIFLVAGPGKAAIYRQIQAGADLPAQRLAPLGTISWLLDRTAYSGVSAPS